MLYMLGALTLDTRPFNADGMYRSGFADMPRKPVIGGLAPSEFTGEGPETLTLHGQILPLKLGGLDHLEIVDNMRRAGTRFPVMRGDGKRFGWFAITNFNETHRDLGPDGVGFTVHHRIAMRKVHADAGDARQIVADLLTLFGEIADASGSATRIT